MVRPAQFDVCTVIDLPGGGSSVALAVVLQHNALDDLATRMVAPLIRLDVPYVLNRAAPMVEVQGERYVMAAHLITTIHVRNFGRVVASLADQDVILKCAIDFGFFGV